MGQVGNGNTISPTLVPKKVTALEGIAIRGISAGTSHSVAWTNSGFLTYVTLDIELTVGCFYCFSMQLYNTHLTL